MIPHRLRLATLVATLIVAALTAAAARYDVAPELVESLRPHAAELLTALVLLALTAGAADAAVVERRRRDPDRAGLSDDVVRSDPGPPADETHEERIRRLVSMRPPRDDDAA